MRKPTGGPWQVVVSDNGQAYEIRSGVFVVARIARTPYSVADANLVAAAPELLGAVKYAIQWVPKKVRPVILKTISDAEKKS